MPNLKRSVLVKRRDNVAAFIYILRCKDGSLYTGWTDDVEKRFKAHSEGKGAKYTSGRGPFELIWQEEVADKSAALKREIEIKKWSRKKKEQFVLDMRKGNLSDELEE